MDDIMIQISKFRLSRLRNNYKKYNKEKGENNLHHSFQVEKILTNQEWDEQLDSADNLLIENSPFQVYQAISNSFCNKENVLVFQKESKKRFLMKIETLQDPDEDLNYIKKEILIQNQVQTHKNILSLFQTYFWKNSIYFICENVSEKDLCEFIQEQPLYYFEEKFISYIMSKLFQAISFMHFKSFIHRNIRASNLFIKKNGEIKLGGLNYAERLTIEKPRCTTIIGSPYWMAPEMISEIPYTGKVDVWSSGILLIECSEGSPPNCSFSPMQALVKISDEPVPELSESERWSNEIKHFLKYMLQKDPRKRCSSEQALLHSFLSFRCTEREFAQLIFQEKK
eukprot:maker-scaffold_22-snap-gene-3.53-mRNA-1 protein AED:0.32 eAED:0.32 QI:56/1/1/1/1/1/4/85/339